VADRLAPPGHGKWRGVQGTGERSAASGVWVGPGRAVTSVNGHLETATSQTATWAFVCVAFLLFTRGKMR
jgi:hypothetical protein